MSEAPGSDELFIGMLSGTSRDGVDAVLVSFSGDDMDLLHALCAPYPAAIRSTLERMIETGAPPERGLAELLDENLGRFFARTAQNLVREAGLEMRDITAIGSHGQTVWHDPGGERPVSIQLGKPGLIARGTGARVVADFRSADIRCGGQGAPLAPLLHRHLFFDEREDRAVLNLGGIANVTLLPAGGGVAGFDCGPGNCLMDGWTSRHLRKDFDHEGSWASKREPHAGLLQRLLDDPYFSRPAPKSTGLEYFNLRWLDERLAGADIDPGVVQATLAELTARSIGDSLRGFPTPRRLLVCGGGAHNVFLLGRLAAALPDTVIESSARHGADPDWLEGLLFAWLARQRLAGRLQDTRAITGARQPLLLGEIFEP